MTTIRGKLRKLAQEKPRQPTELAALTVSGGSSRGANIRIFGFDIEAPWVDCPAAARCLAEKNEDEETASRLGHVLVSEQRLLAVRHKASYNEPMDVDTVLHLIGHGA
jgi:hypothetical protein